MPIATLSFVDADRRPPEVRPAQAVPSLSLALVEGARECLELARQCIRHGSDPRRQLRWAMVRIKKLPEALAPPEDAEILACLVDLTEYMCRELRSIRDATGVATLERMYDLLCEIRRAWVVQPLAAPTPRAEPARQG
jgi:flagellin-specific chaperone FliS